MKQCVLCAGGKPVFVRAYTRLRLGRLEHVTQHCRSRPGQHQY